MSAPDYFVVSIAAAFLVTGLHRWIDGDTNKKNKPQDLMWEDEDDDGL